MGLPSAAGYSKVWMQFFLVYSRAAWIKDNQPIFLQGPPFLEQTIRRLFEDIKWAGARWRALCRGVAAVSPNTPTLASALLG